MNLERGSTNELLIPGRQLPGETHYLLVFTNVENKGIAKAITINTGSRTGPLLLAFEEVDGGFAGDAQVELAAGDWQLMIYAQGDAENLDVEETLRYLWTEQVRVDGAGGAIPLPDTGGCDAPQIFSEQYLGDNAPKAVEFIALPGFYAGVALVDPDVLRFPGGTNANYVDEVGDVSAMATMAAALGVPVIWVANLYSGTYADCSAALALFAAAGVDVLAVSITNEPYLKKYDDRWPLPANYVDEAKAFADWFRETHPGIPVAVPIAPSAAMHDPDSGEGGAPRLARWRAALLACTWADLWELHSYATPGEEAEHRIALDAYVRTLCKQVILGEWSVKQPEGDTADYTDNRIVHHAVMTTWLQANPRIIPIATEHNLISNNPNGYNKLTVTGGEVVLTPFGAATIPENCDPVLVDNSDATYSFVVEPGDSHMLPDVTHTDSDGSPVVLPGMTPFVATLCGGDPCLITFEVYLHGVLEDTIVDVDPCDIDNAIAITLT